MAGPGRDDPAADPCAADLFAAAERQLHGIAAALLRNERADHTLQPTALLHEAWLRLQPVAHPWRDQTHFVQAAAGTMRRVLVDHARARAADKRSGGQRITLSPELLGRSATPDDLVAVDEALQRLATLDAELVRIVELRVFGGLDHPTIARLIDRSPRTVDRGWRLARAFLCRQLGGGDDT